MDAIRSIPPVTRFLCGSSLAVTLPIMLQILSLRRLILVWPLVIQRFEVRLPTLGGYIRSEGAQLWRVWTTFFFGGIWPSNIFLLCH
jgi:Derlin-2/3